MILEKVLYNLVARRKERDEVEMEAAGRAT